MARSVLARWNGRISMKVFISVDLEGISGVFAEAQTTIGTAPYQSACAYLRADVDAVIEGCLAAGATEIVVADSHAQGANLAFEGLADCVTLVSGSPMPLSMMEGVDADCTAAMLIGYHACAGTAAAVLEHTYTYDVLRVTVGGREVGESGINAAVAGAFGVPVVLVSGDDKLASEAEQLIPGVVAAVVKDGLMRTSARLLSPEAARATLRDSAQRALSASSYPKPLDFGTDPLRVTFVRAEICDAASRCPGVTRLDGCTLEIKGADYLASFGSFLACLALANGAPH
jgi:D-amino peptidase